MMEKIIGKRIAQYRRRKGMTQEELSEILEITPHYLSALERGLYNIKLEMLVKILNTLECSADEVFCDVVDKSSSITTSRLSMLLNNLPIDEQKKILAVVETMIGNASK
ncbi:MAG: helix-turn-helix transcriptional regulator [Clostridia bacterium]|nr:helix-turn-helix transcriptional regulator [Clostridia bacterium]